MFEKAKLFVKKIKENKIYRILLIIFLILIVFLFFSSDNKKSEITKKEEDLATSYVENMQKNLENILSKIENVGKVEVMISVESGMETVIATTKNVKQTASGEIIEETPILVNGKTVTLKEKYPKIQGVVVICEGGKNIAVINSIINAVTSLLNVEVKNIQVIKMK